VNCEERDGPAWIASNNGRGSFIFVGIFLVSHNRITRSGNGNTKTREKNKEKKDESVLP